MSWHAPSRIASIAVAWALLAGLAGADSLTFTLDGQPASGDALECGGDPDVIGEGDLVEVGGIWLRLDAPGPHRFAWARPGRLVLETAEAARLVGVADRGGFLTGELVRVDELAAASEGECAGLWGVRIEGGVVGTADRLAALDLTRVALTLVVGSGADPDRTLPIPEGAQWLAIGPLAPDDPGVRAALSHCRGLRALVLRGSQTSDLTPLAGLPALVSLDVSGTKVTDLSPLRDCGALRTLEVAKTRVSDLAPLVALPALRRVVASGTYVRTLPSDGFAAMRHLDLDRAWTRTAEVGALRVRLPQCSVRHQDWGEALRARLAGCTRVRVRDGGLRDARPGPEHTRIDERDPAMVAALVAALALDPEAIGFRCLCPGHWVFEFHRANDPVASVGLNHGTGLVWAEGAGIVGAGLTPASTQTLYAWLVARGVTPHRREWDAPVPDSQSRPR